MSYLVRIQRKGKSTLQNLISDQERALPASCKISETKQQILTVLLFH